MPSSGVLLVASQKGMWGRFPSHGNTFIQVTMGGNITDQYITGLVMNPGTPSSIWDRVEGHGIFVSTDQGASFPANLWTSSNGGPTSYSFISLGVSSDGNTMYANIASSNGLGSSSPPTPEYCGPRSRRTPSIPPTQLAAATRSHPAPMQNPQLAYDQTLGVDLQDANLVYMGFQDLWLSQDGGDTWTDVTYDSTYATELMHVDHHALVFSPPSHRSSGRHPAYGWEMMAESGQGGCRRCLDQSQRHPHKTCSAASIRVAA